jgi:hypothetical protein
VPTATPLTTPAPLTVAAAVLVLIHVPPDPVVVNDIELPAHTPLGPLIVPGTGSGFTVIGYVADDTPHELVTVYDMVDVPKLIPVTIPVGDTVALLLLAIHVPPVAPLAFNIIPEPSHTVLGPLIVPAFGVGTIVTITVVVIESMPSDTCTLKESLPL